MKPDEYIQQVLRSESTKYRNTILKDEERILHGAIGCVTESGELLDNVKKFLFYGKTIDRTNLKEEIGDLLWYIGIILDTEGLTFEEVMETNIAKLRSRYPDKFTTEKAINRNLEKERDVLEGNNTQ